jgi:ribosomal protein S18 acetylase RimI-like enzyme
VDRKITIRPILSGEWAMYKSIRLASLLESPTAFKTTYAEAGARTSESWVQQAESAVESDDRCILFALRETKPVGVCAIYRNESDRMQAQIMQVWVSPEQRHFGIARRLIEEALKWALHHHISVCIAKVRPDNQAVMKFYEKNGFVRAGAIPSLLSPGIDEYLMIKDLGKTKKSLIGASR